VRNFTLLAFGLAALAGSACASEEDILPAQKISIALTADGRSFGEVSATIETMPDGQGRKIKAVVLHVGGKKFDVPQAQFADLRNPVLNTAEFRTEGGRDSGPPWLYLTFRLHRSGALPSACPLVYIRFRGGQLHDRSIHDPKTADDAP
jgi:hypothetical protein